MSQRFSARGTRSEQEEEEEVSWLRIIRYACYFCCCVGAIISIVACAAGLCSDDDDDGFCCARDPYVYEGSPWASASPTLCGNFDYNCDNETDRIACCGPESGIFDDGRMLFNTTDADDACRAEPERRLCGACTGPEVFPGWSCSEETHAKKRFVAQCPCVDSGPVPVTGEAPAVGECAFFVEGCVGSNAGDEVVCCQVAAL